ncbi:MAG TPA: ABC transporter substrate-binding protein [Gammaproteobacteria bacterium]|nr:ABC transporter substrate-binding protein [Gammaproteobacteria bacterium]
MHTSKINLAVLRTLLLIAALGCAASLHASSDITPLELVQDTSSRMLAALKDNKAAIKQDSSRLYDLVSTIVLPYFDFERMSQWVLGKNWRTATPEQRDRFVEQFRALLVRTYGQALSDYANEKIIYLPFAGDLSAPTVTVRTEIEQAGSTIPISYSMYRSRDGWKVYDVAISGVSLVTNYRSSFGNIIRDKGIDNLIRQLTDKNRS